MSAERYTGYATADSVRIATRRRTASHVVAHPGPSDCHREAMDGSCSDDSEIEEEWACGGPGPTGGGPEQEDRGGSGPTTSKRNAGGAFNNRMTAETLHVRMDIACVFYICSWAVTTTRKWY